MAATVYADETAVTPLVTAGDPDDRSTAILQVDPGGEGWEVRFARGLAISETPGETIYESAPGDAWSVRWTIGHA